jgi:ELWxxDGT repeat protein
MTLRRLLRVSCLVALTLFGFMVAGTWAASSRATLVKDITPGSGSGTSLGPIPSTVLNGILYFTATDGVTGTELWRSDGTAAGTFLVKDLNPGATGSNPIFIGAAGGSGFMSATDEGTFGTELWKTTRQRSDFDGEGRADVVVYRPGGGQWWINRSASNYTTSTMGARPAISPYPASTIQTHAPIRRCIAPRPASG